MKRNEMKWKEIPVGCRRWRDGQPQFQQMDFFFYYYTRVPGEAA
jgi:hypothetical protein